MRMMKEEVRHIALLARVGMTDGELEELGTQMSRILDHFDHLQEVDTREIEPTGHSSDLIADLRNDVVKESQPEESIMANVPQREAGFVRIKSVLE